MNLIGKLFYGTRNDVHVVIKTHYFIHYFECFNTVSGRIYSYYEDYILEHEL